MEDTKPAATKEPSGAPAVTKIPVMDEQPQGPSTPINLDQTEPTPQANENPNLTFEENTPGPSKPQPSEPESAPAPPPPPPVAPPQPPAAEAPTPPTLPTESDSTVHPHAPLQTAPKKKTPLPVIIVALFVAAGLAVVLVYVFMKGRESTKTTTTTPPAASQQASVAPKDIDTATTDIDKSVSAIDETKDLSATDLSDQTLGL
jgi:hypothetical protein